MTKSLQYEVKFSFDQKRGFKRHGIIDFDPTFSIEVLTHDFLDHALRDSKGNLEDDGSPQCEFAALGYSIARLIGQINIERKKHKKIIDYKLDLFSNVVDVFDYMLLYEDYLTNQRVSQNEIDNHRIFRFLKEKLSSYYSDLTHKFPLNDNRVLIQCVLNEMFEGYETCLKDYKSPENYFEFFSRSEKQVEKFLNDLKLKNYQIKDLVVFVDVEKMITSLSQLG